MFFYGWATLGCCVRMCERELEERRRRARESHLLTIVRSEATASLARPLTARPRRHHDHHRHGPMAPRLGGAH